MSIIIDFLLIWLITTSYLQPLTEERIIAIARVLIPTLGTILAISFAVLFFYFQISSDKFSIQFMKYALRGWSVAALFALFMLILFRCLLLLGNPFLGSSLIYYTASIYASSTLFLFELFILISYFGSIIRKLDPSIFIHWTERIVKIQIHQATDKIQTYALRNQILDVRLTEVKLPKPIGFPLEKHSVTIRKEGRNYHTHLAQLSFENKRNVG
jgi:hypothetical protein